MFARETFTTAVPGGFFFVLQIKLHKLVGGGGGRDKDGTEKRRSYNLQSGHLAG